ncbi:hypothetical protein ABMA27_008565 [Loxostege sticticalis]|uniref:Metalloendopeptidase n=1 Tax=Loxostege sticticalis TaxID=481309 RepID=A0ABR3HBT6_LOXSC
MAMTTIEETSCVRFKPILTPWSDSHWIHITNKDGVRECVHDTAVNGSSTLEIVMTMGIECMQRRDILHLLMHALGFNDEITHPQRDQYVRVLWDNINPAYRPLFRIRYEEFSSRQTEYDPMSIMHFHDRAFTMNGQATIQPLIPGLVINPSWELSPLDKMKLRLMFGHECNRREVNDLLDSCKNAIHNEKGGHSKNEANEDDSDYDAEVDNDIKEEVSEQKEEVDEQQEEEDASKYKNLESLGETEKPAVEDKFKNLDYVETEKPAVREATIIV